MIALTSYINDDGHTNQLIYDPDQTDDFQGLEQLADPSQSSLSTRRVGGGRMVQYSGRGGSVIDDVISPSRDGTSAFSFGGPDVTPLAGGSSGAVSNAASGPLRPAGRPMAISLPRGSAAPTGYVQPPRYLPPLVNAPTTRFTATDPFATDRASETIEQRHARRIRDRAIIAGTLVPERRRDEDHYQAAEIAAEQERIAAQQADAIARLSTSRPALGQLTSPQSVRIPQRPGLATEKLE